MSTVPLISLICICLLFMPLSASPQHHYLTQRSQMFTEGVVVSQHPLATEVGTEVLQDGGNAIDAAVATAYALSVVAGNGSGLGGGGFALIYLAKEQKTIAVDFRERAPLSINRKSLALNGPRAGGIPGQVAGLEHLRSRYGSKTRQDLLSRPISLAKNGFPIESLLHNGIKRKQKVLKAFPSSAKVFLDKEGQVPPIGYQLRQPDLAGTLEAISRYGSETFYDGKLARRIARGIQDNGGLIGLEDLQRYKVYEERPICGTYRNKYRICSFPLPSSGGICLVEALNILENFDLPSLEYKDPQRLYYIIETLKHVFYDRASKLGDRRFVDVLPVEELTSKEYAKEIASEIRQGKLNMSDTVSLNKSTESNETTHFTVVDKQGNIVSITSSLGGALGSGFLIPGTGILFNNTLDDFSLPSGKVNQYGLLGNKFNHPAPQKTPLSSMSPTIVFDNESKKPILALGSPGGPTIISAVLNVLLARLDQQMTIKDAVESGRVHHQWKPDIVFSEKSIINETCQKELQDKYGYSFPKGEDDIWVRFYWAVQAIELDRTNRKITGIVDPRSPYGAEK